MELLREFYTHALYVTPGTVASEDYGSLFSHLSSRRVVKRSIWFASFLRSRTQRNQGPRQCLFAHGL